MKFMAYLIIDEVAYDKTEIIAPEGEDQAKQYAMDIFKTRPKNHMWTITPDKIELEPR